MEDKNNIHRFLDKEEITNIINLIKEVEVLDVKCRLYLLTLGFRSIDIQNLTIEEGEKLINEGNIPDYMATDLTLSLNNRLKSIEEKGLTEDIEYFFANLNDKHIHDRYPLNDWRRFLKQNKLGNINMNVYRQSINYFKLYDKYQKSKEKEYEMEV